MPRKGIDVLNQLRGLGRRRRSADAASESYGLAGNFALEGAED